MGLHLRMIKEQITCREGVLIMAEQTEQKKGIGPKVQAFGSFLSSMIMPISVLLLLGVLLQHYLFQMVGYQTKNSQQW